MNLLGIGTVIESVGKIAGDLITTDKERLELELRAKELDQALDLGQIGVNTTEAQHPSVFVAGWRPYVGWVCGGALTYQFILYPLMVWAWRMAQAFGHLPPGIEPPPMLDTDALWVILSGMLGIAGMRSYEKFRGVARQ